MNAWRRLPLSIELAAAAFVAAAFVAAVLGAAAPGAAAADPVWKLRIHRGDAIYEQALAEVDSLTFRPDSTFHAMAAVPPGSFVMGDGTAVCGRDQRTVTLTRGFSIGRHEVTNGEYLDLLQGAYDAGLVTATLAGVFDRLDGSTALLLDMSAEGCEIRLDASGRFYLRRSNTPEALAAYPRGYDPSVHPVKRVTWYGAAAYCDWRSVREGLPRAYDHSTWTCNGGDPYGAAGYRLPTDAEWEYAAQFDDERAFPWGDDPPTCERANFYVLPEICVGWTVPEGTFPDAPAALGLANLSGNMWEYCNDWHACDLGTQPALNPVGPPAGPGRVVRGGGFASVDYDLRCSFRAWSPPGASTNPHGFRVARSAAP